MYIVNQIEEYQHLREIYVNSEDVKEYICSPFGMIGNPICNALLCQMNGYPYKQMRTIKGSFTFKGIKPSK